MKIITKYALSESVKVFVKNTLVIGRIGSIDISVNHIETIIKYLIISIELEVGCVWVSEKEVFNS